MASPLKLLREGATVDPDLLRPVLRGLGPGSRSAPLAPWARAFLGQPVRHPVAAEVAVALLRSVAWGLLL